MTHLYLYPGRVISAAAQENRRRPNRPQTGARRPLSSKEQERPQEIIPQQLLDLQDFGQTGDQLEAPEIYQITGISICFLFPDEFSRPPPPRARVPVGRPRPAPVAAVEGEEKEEFFTNLRTTIRQRERAPSKPQRPSATREFTRPPRR